MNIVIPCLSKCALFCVRVCSLNHFFICTEIDLTIQIETGLPGASMQVMFMIQHKTKYCYYFLMWIVQNTYSNILHCRHFFLEIFIDVFVKKMKKMWTFGFDVMYPGMYWFKWNACLFCYLLLVLQCNWNSVSRNANKNCFSVRWF